MTRFAAKKASTGITCPPGTLNGRARLREPLPQRAQHQRTGREGEHGRGGDEADQLLPARERQEDDQPDHEGDDQADQRDAAVGRAGQRLRGVAVLGHRVGDPRGGRGVDQPGVSRGDDRVGVQHDREPAEADRARRWRPAGRSRSRRTVRTSRCCRRGSPGGERADEGELQRDVDEAGDQHRADHRDGDVALRVVGLAGELDALAEAEVGEDDPGGGDRLEDAVPARGHEAVAGEVLAVERGDQEGDDHQQDHRDLPADQDVVDPGEPADAVVVDDHEDGHQHHRAGVAEGGQRVHGLAVDDVLAR